MINIINELNLQNGSNYKIQILKKYKDNELFKRILKMTYDRVTYTYGVSQRTLKRVSFEVCSVTLIEALDFLENKLSTRESTGNSARDILNYYLDSLSADDSEVLWKIIGRDLKIGIGRTQINKVFKELITKPIYQRCETFNNKSIKGTASNILYPAILNLKADGTYRETNVSNEGIYYHTRSGENHDYPTLTKEFELLREKLQGRFFGELTVELDNKLLDYVINNLERSKEDESETIQKIKEDYLNNQKILPRGIGNGMINSDNVPHENLVMDLWEYVSEEEYRFAGNLKNLKLEHTQKLKDIKLAFDSGNLTKQEFKELTINQKIISGFEITTKSPKIEYITRFNELKNIINELGLKQVRVIEHKVVNSSSEAMKQVSEWMKLGLEGGVLKNYNMVFEDGTNKNQLKMKLIISAEMRCTGYQEGRGKREGKIGSLIFENDEGTINGQTSGFTDAELDEFTNNFDKYKNKILEVEFNDISKARGSKTYSLSHPRFIEWRNDKDETDTLEKVQQMKEMAISLAENN